MRSFTIRRATGSLGAMIGRWTQACDTMDRARIAINTNTYDEVTRKRIERKLRAVEDTGMEWFARMMADIEVELRPKNGR